MTNQTKPNRIIGLFIKQETTQGNRYIRPITGDAEVKFDATLEIISMSASDIHAIQDDDMTTDDIGRKFVSWDGPCEVRLEDPIKDFFGVDDLEAITEEMLEASRAPFADAPFAKVTFHLDSSATAPGKVNFETGEMIWDEPDRKPDDSSGVLVEFAGKNFVTSESPDCLAKYQYQLVSIAADCGLTGLRRNLVSMKLELDMTYDLAEVPSDRRAAIIERLRDQLVELVSDAMDDGRFTGSTDATVHQHSDNVGEAVYLA